MFIERDFQVKQQQINDQLRQRELERQFRLADGGQRVNSFRFGRQLIRRVLRIGIPRVPTQASEAC